MDKITSLCKRRGFIYQSSEIYGGFAGAWDYGPLGLALKENIKRSWWRRFIDGREDMYGLDAAILMNAKVWEASGHAAGFADPLVECKKCKKRSRADALADEFRKTNPELIYEDPRTVSLHTFFGSYDILCPGCQNNLRNSGIRQFNMMFKTNVGAAADESSVAYLRPETAQGIFVNFKNIVDSFHPKLPFGIAQIGKAFRNEIAPRDFLFRTREFEQMEIEYFVRETEWEKYFEEWRVAILEWLAEVGISRGHVKEIDVSAEDRAHYSKRTIDFEYDYPFGTKELCGLAYRTDYDLKRHAEYSGADLAYYDDATKERFIPHVIEPSLGVDRLVLALLSEAYTEDELGGDKRVLLKLPPQLAPVKVAVFPLLRNKLDLVAKALTIYKDLQATSYKLQAKVVFDDNGNIGKRYRRQDEIGTPYCVTVDFETLEKNTLTLRDRDSGGQKRIAIEELKNVLKFDLHL